MKITEALCNVITEAGGTPTTADSDSITHALGTLYTTLGGTDTLPDDVADRINSLSDHIGGGGSAEMTMQHVDIVNNTSVAVIYRGLATKSENGIVYATNKLANISSGGGTKTFDVTSNNSSASNSILWAGELTINKSVDPTKVVATISAGEAYLLRNESRDSSTVKAFILFVNVPTASMPTEGNPVVTISVSA